MKYLYTAITIALGATGLWVAFQNFNHSKTNPPVPTATPTFTQELPAVMTPPNIPQPRTETDSQEVMVTSEPDPEPNDQELPPESYQEHPRELSQEQTAHIEETVKLILSANPDITNAWKTYRLQVYKNMFLSEANIAEFTNLMQQHDTHIEEIFKTKPADYYDNTDKHEGFNNTLKRAQRNRDKAAQQYLGAARFEYLKKVRAQFNTAYFNHSGNHLYVDSW